MRALVPLICLVVGCSGMEPYEGGGAPSAATEPTAAEPAAGAEPPTAAERSPVETAEVFIDVAAFEAARSAGATVLDARPGDAYEGGHVPGAFHTPWERFVDGEQTGLLSDDQARLERELGRTGVESERPVLVYGQWQEAWGEEGRIFWMLEYFGHRDVRVLSGGVAAYEAAGHALSTEVPAPASGSFAIRPRPEVRATAEEIQQALDGGDVVILDIRTLAEYEGMTPHGSDRGGHIPAAVHFHWRDIFTDAGALLPATDVRAHFAQLGIGDDTLVITYCTGGIRSGFIYAVMRSVGYPNPRNYDGSWWEWSSRTELPVER